MAHSDHDLQKGSVEKVYGDDGVLSVDDGFLDNGESGVVGYTDDGTEKEAWFSPFTRVC